MNIKCRAVSNDCVPVWFSKKKKKTLCWGGGGWGGGGYNGFIRIRPEYRETLQAVPAKSETNAVTAELPSSPHVSSFRGTTPNAPLCYV
jgi:hypothetical protein